MQEAIYAFICEFIGTHGYSPSYREIGKAVGLKSTSSVLHHLDALAAKGLIGYVSFGPRTIHLKNTDKDRSRM